MTSENSQIQLLVGVFVPLRIIDEWIQRHVRQGNALDELSDDLSSAGYFSLKCMDDSRKPSGLFVQFKICTNSFGECTIMERFEYEEDLDALSQIMGMEVVAGIRLCAINYMQVHHRIVPVSGQY